MRIARFTTGQDPVYGVIGGPDDAPDGVLPDDDTVVIELTGDPMYGGIKPTGAEHRLGDVRLLAPVIPRSKAIGIGRNYAAHAAELGHEVPTEPIIFIKPNTSVIGPGDPIFYPRMSSEVHFEGELAVVIGRICREVAPEQATDVIYGYTIANDVTARDLQHADGRFTRAKGFDSFCPIGPWIETDRDPQHFADGVRLQTHLNGDLKQDADTSAMVFDIPALIAYVTSIMTLLPGDVILTGTPEGVGPMEVGDEVEVTIEGLGSLTNTVASRD